MDGFFPLIEKSDLFSSLSLTQRYAILFTGLNINVLSSDSVFGFQGVAADEQCAVEGVSELRELGERVSVVPEG